MRMALPLLRPVGLAIVLPATLLACLSALGPAAAPAAPVRTAGPWVYVTNEGSGDQDPEAFDLLPDGRLLVVSNEETARRR